MMHCLRKTIVTYILFTIFTAFQASAQPLSLINSEYIRSHLTYEADWAESHEAEGDYLGCGMLYYALAYVKKAKLSVCLGSGGGFVPRIMRQAQRDLKLVKARTILIDANTGSYGRPQWLSNDHFFKKAFPDIEIIMDLTSNVAHAHPEWKIDYLHIDADHSFEGAMSDFYNYLPLMNEESMITFHDTNGLLPCSKVIKILKKKKYELVNFKEYGAGVAIIHLHKKHPKR
ncbi:MAG: class I SAM-dependent methyltransferase [Simkaniaceae bacterium]|nr:class I SAM-dependent methyltransferase [Simkaniaceae bacterium]